MCVTNAELNMTKQKNLKDIRNELLQAFLELEASYLNGPTTTTSHIKIAYLEIDMCEHLLNAVKALEYHYRDDIPEMRTKKNWNTEMKNAHKLLKKYGENSEKGNSYSKLQLQRKYDDHGYLEQKDWLKDARLKREPLKKNCSSL